jgi:hypothetical protein
MLLCLNYNVSEPAWQFALITVFSAAPKLASAARQACQEPSSRQAFPTDLPLRAQI